MKTEIKQRVTQLNNGEVPSGYEKTEFGVFPCDWVTNKKLKDFFKPLSRITNKAYLKCETGFVFC